MSDSTGQVDGHKVPKKSVSRVTLLVVVGAVLVGCMTPALDMKQAQQRFGPNCVEAGYEVDTPGWNDCVIAYEEERRRIASSHNFTVLDFFVDVLGIVMDHRSDHRSSSAPGHRKKGSPKHGPRTASAEGGK